MIRRTLLMGLAVFVLSACSGTPSTSSMAGGSDAILGALTSQLGITETQAAGGVGSYLTLAQEKLVKGEFDKVAALIPGASKYMEQAKALGAVTGPIGSMSGLSSSLGKLGVNPATAAKFAPAVTATWARSVAAASSRYSQG